jgi:hypothetical protein
LIQIHAIASVLTAWLLCVVLPSPAALPSRRALMALRRVGMASARFSICCYYYDAAAVTAGRYATLYRRRYAEALGLAPLEAADTAALRALEDELPIPAIGAAREAVHRELRRHAQVRPAGPVGLWCWLTARPWVH